MKQTRLIESFDLFGQRVPSFKIDGDDRVRSKVGGISTAIMILVTLSLAIVKSLDIQTRQRWSQVSVQDVNSEISLGK